MRINEKNEMKVRTASISDNNILYRELKDHQIDWPINEVCAIVANPVEYCKVQLQKQFRSVLAPVL